MDVDISGNSHQCRMGKSWDICTVETESSSLLWLIMVRLLERFINRLVKEVYPLKRKCNVVFVFDLSTYLGLAEADGT
jgi:hypothetical protein